jgi:hypothetical protein
MKVEIQKQLIIEMWNALSIIERIYFLSDNFIYDQLESEFISKFKFENLNTRIQNKIFNKIIQKSK